MRNNQLVLHLTQMSFWCADQSAVCLVSSSSGRCCRFSALKNRNVQKAILWVLKYIFILPNILLIWHDTIGFFWIPLSLPFYPCVFSGLFCGTSQQQKLQQGIQPLQRFQSRCLTRRSYFQLKNRRTHSHFTFVSWRVWCSFWFRTNILQEQQCYFTPFYFICLIPLLLPLNTPANKPKHPKYCLLKH